MARDNINMADVVRFNGREVRSNSNAVPTYVVCDFGRSYGDYTMWTEKVTYLR